ncbi:hypothetical protein CC99x_005410 [Candidatus Berkiella cookevillensis]|uniref:YfdX protein n=1 Tax=Candidatus Berkiella cookevillensis TaxID=437022 RepID=A0A0Q9YVE7_9GAMM|nr:hypothetical protein [Candidatus Berkiella cookevillensis]MCS5708339.1 hypothetical protein [Candidatus Berkiella cookevillensis]
MKMFKLPYYLTSLALVSGLGFSQVVLAEADGGASVVQAIKELDANNQNGFNSNGLKLDEIRESVTKHYELSDSDYRNKEVASALINYWADAALKEYEFKKELLFMNAPGTEKAIEAGKLIGESVANNYAQELVETNFKKAMGAYWPTEDGAEPIVAQSVAPKIQLFIEMMRRMEESPGNVNSLNLGNILSKDRVEKEAAEGFIAYLTNPYPKVDQEIAAKMKSGTELTVAEKEKVAEKLIESINMAPSVTAFSELFARRIAEQDAEGTPEEEKHKTVMELVNEYSKLRFNTPEWYGMIGKASDTALLREMVHLLAYNTWMDQQAFKMKEQEVALLATMNANFTRMYAAMQGLVEQLETLEDDTRKQAWEAEKKIRELKLETDTTETPAE